LVQVVEEASLFLDEKGLLAAVAEVKVESAKVIGSDAGGRRAVEKLGYIRESLDVAHVVFVLRVSCDGLNDVLCDLVERHVLDHFLFLSFGFPR